MQIQYILNYLAVHSNNGIVEKIQLCKGGDWFDVPLDDEENPLTKELRQWEAANYQVSPQEPDWAGLVKELRGSELFSKVYGAVKANSQLAVPFNLLISTLNASNPSIQDLQFALQDLRMLASDAIAESDVQKVNELLTQYHFPFRV